MMSFAKGVIERWIAKGIWSRLKHLYYDHVLEDDNESSLRSGSESERL